MYICWASLILNLILILISYDDDKALLKLFSSTYFETCVEIIFNSFFLQLTWSATGSKYWSLYSPQVDSFSLLGQAYLYCNIYYPLLLRPSTSSTKIGKVCLNNASCVAVVTFYNEVAILFSPTISLHISPYAVCDTVAREHS